jgi:prophage antirepressor-like protein
VVLLSRKPEAKKFKKWITSEVLPSIRKHGAYMTPETLEAAILNPDYLIKVATALK